MANPDYIQHYTGVRLRVKGVGNLDVSLISLDNITTQNLESAVMSATTEKLITKLANLSEARARVRVSIDAISEKFEISSITVYVKPLWTSYPQ